MSSNWDLQISRHGLQQRVLMAPGKQAMTRRSCLQASRTEGPTRRTRAAAVMVVLLCFACTRTYVVVPATGGTMGQSSRVGLTLHAVPNAWSDDPSDLNQYLTPIWIQLVNQRKEDIRVIYADFALTNSSGFRYAAISPYPNQGTVPANPPPPATATPPLAPPPPSDAAPGASNDVSDWYFDTTDGSQEQAQLAPLGDGTASVELMRGRRGGGHMGGRMGGFGHVGPQFGAGFYGHSYYHGYHGYYSAWPHFYTWPPYYGPYVYYWGERYYPAGPSEAVMQYGLPEGVLHAGGHVSGFVYFQNASAQATNLDLTWTPHTAVGATLATLHVPLSVVED